MGEKKFLDPDEKPLDAIERALLKRALGFRQQEVHTEEMIDKNSGEVLETARRRSVTKEVVPDVRALLFWLKNRRPERWRERREAEEKSPEFDFDSTDEQLYPAPDVRPGLSPAPPPPRHTVTPRFRRRPQQPLRLCAWRSWNGPPRWFRGRRA